MGVPWYLGSDLESGGLFTMVPYPHQAFQDVSYRAVMTGWLC